MNAKSDQRAQGNTKRPSGSGSQRQAYTRALIPRKHGHHGQPAPSSPHPRSPRSHSTTTGPRPQPVTAPHPGHRISSPMRSHPRVTVAYTGYRIEAASTASRGPAGRRAALLPARPAPDLGVPRGQPRRRPAHQRAAAASRSRALSSSSSATRARSHSAPHQMRAHAAYRTQAAVHQSRRSVTSTTRRAGSQRSETRPSPRPPPAPDPSSRTPSHPG